MQATAAILGGTQSLHTNSKDEALALPTEESAQIALRTQQILGYETGISDVSDPLSGSYYVESLTKSIVEKTLELINEIDEKGGAIIAIENNFQQNKIADSAFEYQQSLEKNEQIIVGLNKFKESVINEDQNILELDQQSINEQLKRLEKFKNNRSKKNVTKNLDSLMEAINTKKNLIPYIINCIKNKCTLG